MARVLVVICLAAAAAVAAAHAHESSSSSVHAHNHAPPVPAVVASAPNATSLSEPFGAHAPARIHNKTSIASAMRSVLGWLGEDPDREGLLKTPHRVAESLSFLTSGYSESLDEIVNNAIFAEGSSEEMVLVRDIEIFSLCEHHMVPFYGKAHIAYVPSGRVIGLSKLARIANMFARRLQVQERLTKQIAEAVQQALQPRGVAVTIEAAHMCMMMRGVQKSGATTVTTAALGLFREDSALRSEFLSAVRR